MPGLMTKNGVQQPTLKLISKVTTKWVNDLFLFIGDYYLFNSLTFLTSKPPALRGGGLDGKQALPIKNIYQVKQCQRQH